MKGGDVLLYVGQQYENYLIWHSKLARDFTDRKQNLDLNLLCIIFINLRERIVNQKKKKYFVHALTVAMKNPCDVRGCAFLRFFIV